MASPTIPQPGLGSFSSGATARPYPVVRPPVRRPVRKPSTTPKLGSPYPARPAPPPQPSLADQAATLVQAQIGPVLQQIADSINRRGQAGAASIAGLTQSYASQLGQAAAAIPGIYGPAKAETAAATQGLADRLTGQGASTGADLAAALKQAGQQGPGDINLPQMGSGAGTAAYGTGISFLDALIANQAAASTERNLEPGFAYGQGVQQLGSFQQQLLRDLADQQGQVTSQVPGLTQSVLNNLQDNAFRDKQFAYQQQQDTYARNQQRAGIVSPTAPTTAGRLSYWQGVAAQRTKDTGDLWVGTSTGIRPADAKPGVAGIQRVRTTQGQASDYLNQQRAVSAQATAQNAQSSAVRAQATAQNAQTAITRENNRHQESVRRLNEEAQRVTISGRNATTAARRAAISKQQADIAARRQAETARHNRATEQIARMRKTATSKSGGSGTIYGPNTP